VVGKGAADKVQVRHMVKYLLQLTGTIQIDASDALAIALCHSHQQQAVLRNYSAQVIHS
jgi:crossover junction endodeoxyribonuclease RuvC